MLKTLRSSTTYTHYLKSVMNIFINMNIVVSDRMLVCYILYLCELLAADNRVKAPRKSHVKDFSIFNQPDEQNYPRLSPQLALATFQYLSTCTFFTL